MQAPSRGIDAGAAQPILCIKVPDVATLWVTLEVESNMPRYLFSSASVLSSLALASATTNITRNDGIHLAIGPTCGRLTAAGNTSDVNAGLLDLKRYKTIVSFGDSYTAGGVRDGSPLAPAVITPPSPKAGGRTTNGPVWIEYIANDTSARFMDYAVGGAVTNKTLWPSKSTASDFIEQVGIFLNQSNNLDPATTLYTVYFGINDVSASHTDGAGNLPVAAQVVLDQIQRLASPPTRARSFLVTDSYGRGSHEAAGDAYKKKIFNGLAKLRYSAPHLQIGYADFGYIWDAVLNTAPGYAAFGYNSPGACALNSSTIIGACDDPDHTFYWIPGHPSKQTHRIMGDYVELAMKNIASFFLILAAGAEAERNDGIKLVIAPTCGKLAVTANVTDTNCGIWDLNKYKTIVSFGDSYTAGGVKDGSPLAPPVIIPPSPKAGGRTTNGPVWIENIANDVGARFMDYAVGGAVTDKSLWLSKSSNWDFVQEVDIFLSQNNSLNPLTTLYTVYFGINDVAASHKDGSANLPRAAQVILDKITLLSSPPTNAQSFLVTDSYGYGTHEAPGEAFKKKVFNGIAELKVRNPHLRFGFVDFAYLWDAVCGPQPGYQSFGYTSIGSCTVNSSSVEGACSDPDHTFYWIPNHPSKQTHRIMADYVEAAMGECH
ncbi:hypothetical protein CTheo_2819 [Ceratobasidium theobromae]|uniref:GDSL-like lipase/acylhydrolase n=1 Tax=Ceratobasidium theobromae TaxID=1582974 RepID=A0A5N5QQ17_9AGAM|nr:hypothetical protein CTheo_2819 [Ceratobasidium theobromae]